MKLYVFTHITHTGEDIHAQTQRIYMHTHNHMQIGEVAEQIYKQVYLYKYFFI